MKVNQGQLWSFPRCNLVTAMIGPILLLLMVVPALTTYSQRPCHVKLASVRIMPGAFVPRCTKDGHYKVRQCHGSIGHCWCVNEMGEEIPGTRTRPGQQPHDCDKSCHVKLASVRIMPGAFVPRCTKDGHYKVRQCHGSIGHCWCVNEMGEEIPGTRTGRGQQPHDCDKSCHVKLASVRIMPGAFVPRCTKDGHYKVRQCHGSIGHCWCVDEMGTEIPETRTGPGQQPHDCDKPCLIEKQESPMLLGSFVPDCTETGKYKAKQCHGSSGRCWCADNKGNKITGSVTGPTEEPANCEKPCLVELEALGDVPMPGQFAPQCTEAGEYAVIQCHGSVGSCWCTDARGTYIPGTYKSIRNGEDPPDCENIVV